MKFYLFVLSILFLAVSCGEENNVGSLDSTNATPPVQQQQPDKMYTITNDFQDHTSVDPAHILLKSRRSAEKYVIPPTKYGPLQLQYAVIDLKVMGECIEIPAGAFPVSVSVCQSSECNSVRSLNVVLQKPAHYNIGGVGGLLTPQIYPVSPCSEQIVDTINNVGEYTDL